MSNTTPYVLRKGGMYYAHDSSGYVSRAELAELYSEDEAARHAAIFDEVRAIPVTDIFKDAALIQRYIDGLKAIKVAVIAKRSAENREP